MRHYQSITLYLMGAIRLHPIAKSEQVVQKGSISLTDEDVAPSGRKAKRSLGTGATHHLKPRAHQNTSPGPGKGTARGQFHMMEGFLPQPRHGTFRPTTQRLLPNIFIHSRQDSDAPTTMLVNTRRRARREMPLWNLRGAGPT